MGSNFNALTERRLRERFVLAYKGIIRKKKILGGKTQVTILNHNSDGLTLGDHPADFSVGDVATLSVSSVDGPSFKFPVVCRWIYQAENSPNRSGWKIIGEGSSLQPLLSHGIDSNVLKSDRRRYVRREINTPFSTANLRKTARRFSDFSPINPLTFFPEDLPYYRTAEDESPAQFDRDHHTSMNRRAKGPIPPIASSFPVLRSTVRIFSAFRDLVIYLLPFKLSRKLSSEGDFAFIAHPRDLSDVQKYFNFAKYFPNKLLLWWLKFQWPISGVRISGVINDKGKEISGWVIFSPLTAREMLRDRKRASRSVIRATRLAYKMGARVIGLGAFTSIVTSNGLDVVNKVPIHVTTGNALSAAGALQNVAAGCHLLGFDLKKTTVAIVGAAGNVGSACARLLAPKVHKLILIDINQTSLKHLADELKQYSPTITPTKGLVKEANVVIAVTNTPGAVVKPEDLSPGCLVVDSAQPKNVSEEVSKARKDVLVVESAVFRFPGLLCPFDMGVGGGESLGCMTETIILASKEGLRKDIIGEITPDDVISIYTAARIFGVKLGYFRASKGFLGERHIQTVKKAIKEC